MPLNTLKATAYNVSLISLKSKHTSPIFRQLIHLFSTTSSESCILSIMPLLSEFTQSADWSDPTADCFSLVACIVQLSSDNIVSNQPTLLHALCEWLLGVFHQTHRLESRPVRVDCLISILCRLCDTKYSTFARNAASKLSFDRFFRLGLLNNRDNIGLSKLVLPLLDLPEPLPEDRGFRLISRLQSVISLLANLANSKHDARSVIDQLAGPGLTFCLRSLHRQLDQTKRSRQLLVEHNATEFTLSQRSLAVSVVRQIINFLLKLVKAGDIEAVCSHSDNLAIIFTIASHWYLRKRTTDNNNKRAHEDDSLGHEAAILFQHIVGDIRLCGRILQPRNGFIKQLLFLALSLGDGPVMHVLAKVVQQSLIIPIKCSNQPDVSGVTELEQQLLLWAFSVGFVNTFSDVSSSIQKRLFRQSSSDGASNVDNLQRLAKRFSKSLVGQESSSKWAQLVWVTFVGLYASLIQTSLALNYNTSSLPFVDSGLSADDKLLSVLVDSVFTYFGSVIDSRDEFQELVRRLLFEAFEAESNSQSTKFACAYQAWFYDELDLTQQCLFSFAPVEDKVTVAIVGSDWHHNLIGSAPWETWQIPVSQSILSRISPFFNAIFSIRWNGEGRRVIPITTPHMSREERELWPLGPLLVIVHLAAGCKWQGCRFLRDLNNQLLNLPAPSSWRGPSEHAAQLIGLADRLLISNDDKPHWFDLHTYLLSSLINLHSDNHAAAFRTLFTTCLRLSISLNDHILLTALLWLALADSRWFQTMHTTTPRTVLQRPLASCLHNLFEYQPYWVEKKEEIKDLFLLVQSILSNLQQHIFSN